MDDSFDAADDRLDDDTLAAMAERLERIPLDEAEWVARLYMECQRARAAEARLAASDGAGSSAALQELEQDIAQIVLDTAEWLRTLWTVGYMGASHLPAQPRSAFPTVEVEDVLKSSLLARIRQGKRPLPFPPPTRWGVPWHDVVENADCHVVEAQIVNDDTGLPVCCTIDGCAAWDVKAANDAAGNYVVQHQGKGPLYRLQMGASGSEATLTREPPQWTRQIATQERAGVRAFQLEWPRDDGSLRRIPLRAATPERAVTEAAFWVANQHPDMYGQVAFEVVGQ